MLFQQVTFVGYLKVSHLGLDFWLWSLVPGPFYIFQKNSLHLIEDHIMEHHASLGYVAWAWLSPLWGWGSLTMTFTGKFVYIWLTISSCYGSIPLTLGLIGRDGGLSTLCHSCRFACQQRMLKHFLFLVLAFSAPRMG